jgi:site-specific recombinase XerD
MKKKLPIARLSEVRDAFIFQCFTGIAYQDIYNLTPENIILVGRDRQRWLIKDRGKTEVSEMVPILPIIEDLIEKYRSHDYCVEYNKLIPINSNTRYNGYLKEIAAICGVNRELKTHLARHTFADIVLNNGASLEDVSRMLGHKSMRTTQRYATVGTHESMA